MDQTNRDEDGADVSLGETLPNTDGQSASLSRETPAVADVEIEKGTEIGRYVVVEPIGSGTTTRAQ